MKSRIVVADGNEIRGFLFRVYPTREQEAHLLALGDRMRRIWNALVRQTEDALDANAAYALRTGLVGPRPVRPNYDGLEPKDSAAAKDAYFAACRAWRSDVHAATKGLPECAFVKFRALLEHFGHRHDYQLFKDYVRWQRREGEPEMEIGASLLQSLGKNYFAKSARRKRFRRKSDAMPVQVRTGACFQLGEFGARGANHGGEQRNYYNCQVSIAGLKIRGRLPGRAPWGRVLGGVSVTKRADGWYASIKQEIPLRAIPVATPGTIVGIDVGLDNVAALSDGRIVRNHRGAAYAQRIAGLQAAKRDTARMQQRAARHAKHLIYNEIVKPLAKTEIIAIEKLAPHIGQMGSSKASAMRKVRELLVERYGERVREVSPAFTSQDCSQCGHRSKESWSYAHGRKGECPSCGHSEDRDVNAARNIAAKAAKEQAA